MGKGQKRDEVNTLMHPFVVKFHNHVKLLNFVCISVFIIVVVVTELMTLWYNNIIVTAGS